MRHLVRRGDWRYCTADNFPYEDEPKNGPSQSSPGNGVPTGGRKDATEGHPVELEVHVGSAKCVSPGSVASLDETSASTEVFYSSSVTDGVPANLSDQMQLGTNEVECVLSPTFVREFRVIEWIASLNPAEYEVSALPQRPTEPILIDLTLDDDTEAYQPEVIDKS